RGWAIRATGPRSSLFFSGTGAPTTRGPWPEPDGFPISLPSPSPPSVWKPPPGLETPLVVESEAMELLDVCARELDKELPGCRVVRAVLEDGASNVEIANSRGVEASYRGRVATLFLSVVDSEPARRPLSELFCAREPRRFHPRALVRRLVDRLILEREGRRIERDRGEVLLAPVVGARILAGLRPLLMGADSSALVRVLTDRSGRLAAPGVTVIDDAGLSAGLFSAPADGEGVPTRRLVLVEEGIYRRPLRAWFEEESDSAPARPTGCLRRPGWRDLPRLGPSHLFFEPEPSKRAASLLGDLTRGYYLTDVLEPGRFDIEGNRFRLPVCGFEVRSAKPVTRVSRAVLSGRLSAVLQGVRGVGRDLTFFSLGSMIGSPSLLVSGIELDDA
ncbi:MAG: metallopeptidase TldD-related protein, partial [Acidobacteriota bacterium]|nr:metallopeptidase TldD-related protein [Acidobacteriota bacterium]